MFRYKIVFWPIKIVSSCPHKHYVQIALRESLWQYLWMRMRFLEGIRLWQFCLKKKSLFSTDIGMGECKTELVVMKLTFLLQKISSFFSLNFPFYWISELNCSIKFLIKFHLNFLSPFHIIACDINWKVLRSHAHCL